MSRRRKTIDETTGWFVAYICASIHSACTDYDRQLTSDLTSYDCIANESHVSVVLSSLVLTNATMALSYIWLASEMCRKEVRNAQIPTMYIYFFIGKAHITLWTEVTWPSIAELVTHNCSSVIADDNTLCIIVEVSLFFNASSLYLNISLVVILYKLEHFELVPDTVWVQI